MPRPEERPYCVLIEKPEENVDLSVPVYICCCYPTTIPASHLKKKRGLLSKPVQVHIRNRLGMLLRLPLSTPGAPQGQ